MVDNSPHEPVARPPNATGMAVDVTSQASSPHRTYPEPPSVDPQLPAGTSYFNPDRSQPPTLSQEDQNLANSLSHDMNGHISGLSPQIGNGPAQEFEIGSQNRMSQSAQQPLLDSSRSGQHSGVDPNQDLSYGVDHDRRKRSKVSRACDECRRKKVRCDSNASDNNTIETCSNCHRLKLTCQFERAPMKRGPSKGYIKELAERVQQVESQIRIPAGYRSSVDAGSPTDPNLEKSYPPVEPSFSGRKRTFSQFDGRDPFAPSSQSRERLTSLGGYGLNQSSRDSRGSLDLAPDQRLIEAPEPAGDSSVNLVKPFWAQETEVEHPRTKTAGKSQDTIGDTWREMSLFNTYLDHIHNDISVLPSPYATVQHHVGKCSSEVALAFTRVLATTCGTKLPNSAPLSDARIRELAWTNAQIPSSTRSMSENIVWLWIYTFMLINMETDLARFRRIDDQLSKRTILNMAIDLGHYLLPAAGQDDLKEPTDSLEPPEVTIQRTRICIYVLARLHTISSGREESIGTMDGDYIGLSTDCMALLSKPTAFLANLGDILSLLPSQMSSITDSPTNSIATVKTRKVVESLMNILLSTFPLTPGMSSLAQGSRLFLSLLLARHTSINDPCDILGLAVELVDTLSTDSADSQDHKNPTARPLDIHLYTLSTLTLLELIDTGDADIMKPSRNALAKLHRALEETSDRARVHRQTRLDDAQSDHHPFLAWPDALLQLIDAKAAIADRIELQSKPVNVGESTDSTAKSPTDCTHNDPAGVSSIDGGAGDDHASTANAAAATEGRDEETQLITSHQQYLFRRLSAAAELQQKVTANGSQRPDTAKLTVVDFSLLTREGYLNVLADLSGY